MKINRILGETLIYRGRHKVFDALIQQASTRCEHLRIQPGISASNRETISHALNLYKPQQILLPTAASGSQRKM